MSKRRIPGYILTGVGILMIFYSVNGYLTGANNSFRWYFNHPALIVIGLIFAIIGACLIRKHSDIDTKDTEHTEKKFSFSRVSVFFAILSIVLLVVGFAIGYMIFLSVFSIVIGISTGIIGIITEKNFRGFLFNLILLALVCGFWMLFILSWRG